MAERRRRVEDMTTAVDTLIKYQKTYNKKYTQEEADDLVQKALMRDRAETLQLYFEMSLVLLRELDCVGGACPGQHEA